MTRPTTYTVLAPCPFCGARPKELSVGMDGNPRWQHPPHDACPIAGHMFGGPDLAYKWENRVALTKQERE